MCGLRFCFVLVAHCYQSVIIQIIYLHNLYPAQVYKP